MRYLMVAGLTVIILIQIPILLHPLLMIMEGVEEVEALIHPMARLTQEEAAAAVGAALRQVGHIGLAPVVTLRYNHHFHPPAQEVAVVAAAEVAEAAVVLLADLVTTLKA